MPSILRLGYVMAVLALGLVACGEQKVYLSENQAHELAWQALEPNSASHERANWEFIVVRRVGGYRVAKQFEGEPASGCYQGPTVAPNGKVDSSGTYWYVYLEPLPATPAPPNSTITHKAPPNVPEPFIFQAFFLIDAIDGQVIARKLHCVIY